MAFASINYTVLEGKKGIDILVEKYWSGHPMDDKITDLFFINESQKQKL